MILRLWRGWTEPHRTVAYRELLTGEIAPAILGRQIPGLLELAVLAREARELDHGAREETLTVMRFEHVGAVREFAGPRPSASVVPAPARALLSSFDEHSQHYRTLAALGPG